MSNLNRQLVPGYPISASNKINPNPSYVTNLSKTFNKNKDESFIVNPVTKVQETPKNFNNLLNKSNINNITQLNNKKSVKVSANSSANMSANPLNITATNININTKQPLNIKKHDLLSILSPKTKKELQNLNIGKGSLITNNSNKYNYSINSNNNETLIEQINLNLNMNNVNNLNVNNYNNINNINSNLNELADLSPKKIQMDTAQINSTVYTSNYNKTPENKEILNLNNKGIYSRKKNQSIDAKLSKMEIENDTNLTKISNYYNEGYIPENYNHHRHQRNNQRFTTKSLILSNEVDINKSISNIASPKYSILIDSLKNQFNEIIGDRNSKNKEDFSKKNLTNVELNKSKDKDFTTNCININGSIYNEPNLSINKTLNNSFHNSKIVKHSPKMFSALKIKKNIYNTNFNVSLSQKALKKEILKANMDMGSIEFDKTNDYRPVITTPAENELTLNYQNTDKNQISTLFSNDSYPTLEKNQIMQIVENSEIDIKNQTVKRENSIFNSSNKLQQIVSTESLPDSIFCNDNRYVEIKSKLIKADEEIKRFKAEETNFKFVVDLMKNYIEIQDYHFIEREKHLIEKIKKMVANNLQEKHNEQINILLKQNNQLKLTILKMLYQSQKYDNEERLYQCKYETMLSQLLMENHYLRSISENVIANKHEEPNEKYQNEKTSSNELNEYELYQKRIAHKKADGKVITVINSLNNSINMNKSSSSILEDIPKDVDLFRMAVDQMNKSNKKKKNNINIEALPSDKENWSNRPGYRVGGKIGLCYMKGKNKN